MTTKRLCIFLFTMLFLITGASAETFNVKKYGARGNGKKLDSPAIQKAIDACHKAGGGTVLVPALPMYALPVSQKAFSVD